MLILRLRLVSVRAFADAVGIHRIADGHRAASTIITCADAVGSTTALYGGHAGHSILNGDSTAFRFSSALIGRRSVPSGRFPSVNSVSIRAFFHWMAFQLELGWSGPMIREIIPLLLVCANIVVTQHITVAMIKSNFCFI